MPPRAFFKGLRDGMVAGQGGSQAEEPTPSGVVTPGAGAAEDRIVPDIASFRIGDRSFSPYNDPNFNVGVAPTRNEDDIGLAGQSANFNVYNEATAYRTPGIGYAVYGDPTVTNYNGMSLEELAASNPELIPDFLYNLQQETQDRPATLDPTDGMPWSDQLTPEQIVDYARQLNLEQGIAEQTNQSTINLADVQEANAAAFGKPYLQMPHESRAEFAEQNRLLAVKTGEFKEQNRSLNDSIQEFQYFQTDHCSMSLTSGGIGGGEINTYQACIDGLGTNPNTAGDYQKLTDDISAKVAAVQNTANQMYLMGATPETFLEEPEIADGFLGTIQSLADSAGGYLAKFFDETFGNLTFYLSDYLTADAAVSWAHSSEPGAGPWNPPTAYQNGFMREDEWKMGSIVFATGVRSGNGELLSATTFDPNNPDHVALAKSILWVEQHGNPKTGHKGKRGVSEYLHDLNFSSMRGLGDEVIDDPTILFASSGPSAIKVADLAAEFGTASKVGKAGLLLKAAPYAGMVALDEGGFLFATRWPQVGRYLMRTAGVWEPITAKTTSLTAAAEISHVVDRELVAYTSEVTSRNVAVALGGAEPIDMQIRRTGAEVETKVARAEVDQPENRAFQSVTDYEPYDDTTPPVLATTNGRNGETLTYYDSNQQPFSPAQGVGLDDPSIHYVTTQKAKFTRTGEDSWEAYPALPKRVDHEPARYSDYSTGTYTTNQVAAATHLDGARYLPTDVRASAVITGQPLENGEVIPVAVRHADGSVSIGDPVNHGNVLGMQFETVDNMGRTKMVTITRERDKWKIITPNNPLHVGEMGPLTHEDGDVITILQGDAVPGGAKVSVLKGRHGDTITGRSGKQSIIKMAEKQELPEPWMVEINGDVVPVAFHNRQLAEEFVNSYRAGKTVQASIPGQSMTVTNEMLKVGVRDDLNAAASYAMWRLDQGGFHPVTRAASVADETATAADDVAETVAEVVESPAARRPRPRPGSRAAQHKETLARRAEQRRLAQQRLQGREARAAAEAAGTATPDTGRIQGLDVSQLTPEEHDYLEELVDLNRRNQQNRAFDEGLNIPDDTEPSIDFEDQETAFAADPNIFKLSDTELIDVLSNTSIQWDPATGTIRRITAMDSGQTIMSSENDLSKMTLEQIRAAALANRAGNFGDALTRTHFTEIDGVPTTIHANTAKSIVNDIFKTRIANSKIANPARKEMMKNIDVVDVPFVHRAPDGTERLMQPIGVKRTETSWIFGFVEIPEGKTRSDVAQALTAAKTVKNKNGLEDFATHQQFLANLSKGADVTTYKLGDMTVYPVSMTSSPAEATQSLVILGMASEANSSGTSVILMDTATNRIYTQQFGMMLDPTTLEKQITMYEGARRAYGYDRIAQTTFGGVNLAHDTLSALGGYLDSISGNYVVGDNANLKGKFLDVIETFEEGKSGIRFLSSHLGDLDSFVSPIMRDDYYEALFKELDGVLEGRGRGILMIPEGTRLEGDELAQSATLAMRQAQWNMIYGSHKGVIFQRVLENIEPLRLGADAEAHRRVAASVWRTVDTLVNEMRTESRLRFPDLDTITSELHHQMQTAGVHYRVLENSMKYGQIDSMAKSIESNLMKRIRSHEDLLKRPVNNNQVLRERMMRMYEVGQLMKARQSVRELVDAIAEGGHIEFDRLAKGGMTPVKEGMASFGAAPKFANKTPVSEGVKRDSMLLITKMQEIMAQLDQKALLIDLNYRNPGAYLTNVESAVDQEIVSTYNLVRSVLPGELTTAAQKLAHENDRFFIDAVANDRVALRNEVGQRLVTRMSEVQGSIDKNKWDEIQGLNRATEDMSPLFSSELWDEVHIDRLTLSDIEDEIMIALEARALSNHLLAKDFSKGLARQIFDREPMQTPMLMKSLMNYQRSMSDAAGMLTTFFSDGADDMLKVAYGFPEVRANMLTVAQMIDGRAPMEYAIGDLERLLGEIGNKDDLLDILKIIDTSRGYNGTALTHMINRPPEELADMVGDAQRQTLNHARQGALLQLGLHQGGVDVYEIGPSVRNINIKPDKLGEGGASTNLLPHGRYETPDEFLAALADTNQTHISVNTALTMPEVNTETGELTGKRLPSRPEADPDLNFYSRTARFKSSDEVIDRFYLDMPTRGNLVVIDGKQYRMEGSIAISYKPTYKDGQWQRDFMVVLSSTEGFGENMKTVRRIEMWKGLEPNPITRKALSRGAVINRTASTGAGVKRMWEKFREANESRMFLSPPGPNKMTAVPWSLSKMPVWNPDELNLVEIKAIQSGKVQQRAGKASVATPRMKAIPIDNNRKKFIRRSEEFHLTGRKAVAPGSPRILQEFAENPHLGLLDGMIVRARKGGDRRILADLYHQASFKSLMPDNLQEPILENGYYHLASIDLGILPEEAFKGKNLDSEILSERMNEKLAVLAMTVAPNSDAVRAADSLEVLQALLSENRPIPRSKSLSLPANVLDRPEILLPNTTPKDEAMLAAFRRDSDMGKC